MLLRKYPYCVYCGNKNFKKTKKQSFKSNFYLDAIIEDLNLSKNVFKKIKTFQCKNCFILQNSPWFEKKIAKKIYSNIYGQHNRSWSNVLNFLKYGKVPYHGELFEMLNKNIKIKNYGEFNSPFMGIFLNYFLKELPYNKKKYFKLYFNLIKYLNSRQVAGKTKNQQKKDSAKSAKSLKIVNKIKGNLKRKVNKFLITDSSSLIWGQNDNHKSVNSKSFANELLDIEIINIEEKIDIKFDLFGIFHTLDHTYHPQRILNYALEQSKFVVIYCHVNKEVEKQHLFSITNEFLNYLKKKKIFLVDLTKIINKKYKSPELYFLCTKQKNLKNIIDKFHD